MKTVQDIREGFFGNVGVTAQTNKEFIKGFLDKLADETFQKSQCTSEMSRGTGNRRYNSSYTLNNVRKAVEAETDTKKFDHMYHNGWSAGIKFYICPDTVVDNSSFTDIPDWLNFEFYKGDSANVYIQDLQNLKTIKNLNLNRSSDIYIQNCPDLVSLEGLPSEIRGSLVIMDCPKLKSLKGCPKSVGAGLYIDNCPNIANNFSDIPSKIGGSLVFKPDTTTTYQFKDILKYVKSIDGDRIEFNHKKIDYEDKVIKKAAKPVAKASTSTDGVAAKAERSESLRLVAADPNHVPEFKVNERNRVFTDQGVEVGRLTRDYTTVYRNVNKVLFIENPNQKAISLGDEIGVAKNKKGQVVCKLVRGKI